jgi:hypothetical protein
MTLKARRREPSILLSAHLRSASSFNILSIHHRSQTLVLMLLYLRMSLMEMRLYSMTATETTTSDLPLTRICERSKIVKRATVFSVEEKDSSLAR